ncbi:MAG: tetratricopeptide repeat protein, partial [Anaerolineae bacterium]|nr:tetratricopeptide repeat protein [Anaerolineae bacterium]
VTCVVFSQSRGPFLGWVAGLYVFALLSLIAMWRWALTTRRLSEPLRRALRWIWVTPIALAILLGGFIILFNLPNSPLAGLRQETGVGRLGTILDLNTGTNRVRTLIWQGAVRMVAPHAPLTYPDGSKDRLNPLRPLIGYGPESMWVAYNPFYPPDLAHLEHRNASPDRSHNETFDALITTGVLGFLAYFYLFTSIFYYSLRWLGLIRTSADRDRFLALSIAGAIAGVIVPWILDKSLRLAGVGLPFGFIVGVVGYITIAAFRSQREISGLETATDESHPRRELLVIALLATIVAHFVEIHFGIAIVATRTYFWALSALLVVVGTGRLQEEASPPATPETIQRSQRRRRRSRRERSAQPSAPVSRSIWAATWPYVLISAFVFLTLVYDYITNPVGDTHTWSVFWQSLTTRYLAQRGHRVPGLGIIWLVVFTWLVGGLLVAGLLGHIRRRWTAREAAESLGLYTVGCWGAFLAFGLYHAGRLSRLPRSGSDIFLKTADHIIVYDVGIFIVLIALAFSLWWQEREHERPTPVYNSWASPVIALMTIVILVPVILHVSINPIRADVLFKQAQQFDGEHRWANSILLYQRALDLAPKEDYYYLFLGRAQLEQARAIKDPAERDRLLHQALATLTRAQKLNPLNTDHTANLARLYRNWGELMTDPAERERLWKKSIEYYEIAIRLSPHAAHLYNECGLMHFLLGDLYRQQGKQAEVEKQIELALARYQRSLDLDQKYTQTYLLLGDLYRTQGKMAKAASAYEKALELTPKQPKVWGVLGYVYAQLGRLDDAIAAYQHVLQYEPNNVDAHRNLALLYERTGRLQDALGQARIARSLAPEAQQQALDQYIKQLESRLKQP